MVAPERSGTDSRMRGSVGESAMHRVVLVDLPIELWNRARQHSDALRREFAFIAAEGREDTDVARRLLAIAEVSDRRYATLNPDAEAQVEAALRRGEPLITVDVSVPADFKQHIIESAPVLLEVDQYCRRGDLLTLAIPDDLRAYWTWYLGEFVRQIDGGEPTPWSAANGAG